MDPKTKTKREKSHEHAVVVLRDVETMLLKLGWHADYGIMVRIRHAVRRVEYENGETRSAPLPLP